MAKIILLHGLHMHSWVMKPLAYLLEQEGFELALFDYYSVLHSMNRHVEDLARWIDENHADETLHFVGHSLGGLVLRNFAVAYPDKVSGRIVTMVRRIKAAMPRSVCSIWVCKSRYWVARIKAHWTAVCLNCPRVLSWAVLPAINRMGWVVF